MKHAFEKFANEFNIHICHYRCNTSIFKSTAYKSNCELKLQRQTFCSINTHRQNGMVERSIKTITTWSCAMLIHAILHWPEQVTMDLWHFAFNYALYLHNYLPKQGHRLAPIKLFTQTTVPNSFFKGAHIWGCLVYVLQPSLHEGKKIPKWLPQCSRGQFLDFSPLHLTQVALVHHLQMGSITPQWNVTFENTFLTVVSPFTAPPSHWADLTQNCGVKYYIVEFDDKG
eukprot:14855143-Ditylum_brightwellii.AAC.1